MNYTILYSTLLNQKDVEHFSKKDLRTIKKSIEEKLTTHPEVFGKPLRFSFKGHRTLRVGDYRIIFRIDGSRVKILVIAHRSIVYERFRNLL